MRSTFATSNAGALAAEARIKEGEVLRQMRESGERDPGRSRTKTERAGTVPLSVLGITRKEASEAVAHLRSGRRICAAVRASKTRKGSAMTSGTPTLAGLGRTPPGALQTRRPLRWSSAYNRGLSHGRHRCSEV